VVRVEEMAPWCFPPTRSYLKEIATHLLHSRDGNASSLGQNWTNQFLDRHPEIRNGCEERERKRRASKQLAAPAT